MTRIRSFVGKQAYRGAGAQDYSDYALSREFRASMDGVLGNLNRWIEHMQGATSAIAREALEPTFEKSLVYVPKKTGELADSGYLVDRQFRGQGVAEMGYGKGGKPYYAIYVHELTTSQHEAPTQAKFLQAAVEEDMGAIQNRVATLVSIASGTGGS